MKTFVLALATITAASPALACTPEAQFIADVASVNQLRYSCEIKIAAPKFFQENQLCPLQLDEVLVNPILAAVECPAVGTEISGVIVQDENGALLID